MSQRINSAIKALLSRGAQEDIFVYLSATTQSVSVQAYVWKGIPRGECAPFYQKWRSELSRENCTFFKRLLVERREDRAEYIDEIWLILDWAQALQIAIVNRFVGDEELFRTPIGYFSSRLLEQFNSDIRTLVAELIQDQKRVIGCIAMYTPLLVVGLVPGGVAVEFRHQITATELKKFVGEIIQFMRKYDRFELTEPAWERLILNKQQFLL
jgi:hypothetical protein